jgi:hypothetical protein
MDEPRTGRSWRKLALLLSVPVAAVAMWVSVAAAGGSGSQDRPRADVAKPKPAKVQKKAPAGAAFFEHGERDCPFKGADVTSADV